MKPIGGTLREWGKSKARESLELDIKQNRETSFTWMGTGQLTSIAHGDGIGQQDNNEDLMISGSSVSNCAFGAREKKMTLTFQSYIILDA